MVSFASARLAVAGQGTANPSGGILSQP
jgi:hypothetical protein